MLSTNKCHCTLQIDYELTPLIPLENFRIAVLVNNIIVARKKHLTFGFDKCGGGS